jgi:hypothetical protein
MGTGKVVIDFCLPQKLVINYYYFLKKKIGKQWMWKRWGWEECEKKSGKI